MSPSHTQKCATHFCRAQARLRLISGKFSINITELAINTDDQAFISIRPSNGPLYVASDSYLEPEVLSFLAFRRAKDWSFLVLTLLMLDMEHEFCHKCTLVEAGWKISSCHKTHVSNGVYFAIISITHKYVKPRGYCSHQGMIKMIYGSRKYKEENKKLCSSHKQEATRLNVFFWILLNWLLWK